MEKEEGFAAKLITPKEEEPPPESPPDAADEPPARILGFVPTIDPAPFLQQAHKLTSFPYFTLKF